MTFSFIGYISISIKSLSNGVYTFNVAYNPPSKNKETIFIRCVIFKEVAALHLKILEYLKKGVSVFISGDITEINTYQKKDGSGIGSSISLVVSTIRFLPKKIELNNESESNEQKFKPAEPDNVLELRNLDKGTIF